MSRYKLSRIISLVFSVCICCILLLIHCDNLIPEEFDEKTFNISALADKACEYLSQDTTGAAYTILAAMRMADIVDSASVADFTHNQIISQSFNQLVSSLDGLTAQELTIIDFPDDIVDDTTYIAYEHTIAQNNILIFISWDLTQDNMDGYIDIDVIRNDTTLVTKNTSMELGTVSGCIDTVIYLSDEGEETGREIIPKIRSQFLLNLQNNTYIIRVINSDPGDLRNFRLIILPS